MSYSDIYRKRLDRHGENPQARLEQGRRKNFEKFLSVSPHRVTFLHPTKKVEVQAVLEPKSQNETRTLMNLLCRADENFLIGSIVEIGNNHYMVYYWQEREDSGYNKYVLVKMTHQISWTGKDDIEYSSLAYMYFQEDNMLRNELKSRSRSDSLYLENLKLNFLLMPTTVGIQVETYIEIATSGINQAFRVTGFDIVSTPGVMYVSMDPTFVKDLTPPPEKETDDLDTDFFWLGGAE